MRIDGRTLSHETSETIRRMAVQRVFEGEPPQRVIASYGLCHTTIYKWINAYEKGGEDALALRRHPGREPRLNEKQMLTVRKWICGKDPRQYGFDFGLWSRLVVADLIERKFGVSLGVTAVGRLLARLGITPQKPLRRAYERDPQAIAHWKATAYPALKKRAKRCQGDIFFGDEAGVRSDCVLGKTWGQRGKTPEVATSGQRQSVNAISAVNELGAFWWEVYTGRMNATVFLGFLRRFMRWRRRPVFLVLDKHPAHRAKIVAKYVQSLRGKFEIHFLPGYAPDLNPDEFVWNHLRQVGTSKTPLRKNESLRSRVERDLAVIKSDPHLVRSFFRAPSVKYTLA
ncbi:MAG: IS630 family transposase [candidate division NC10 bacterium]